VFLDRKKVTSAAEIVSMLTKYIYVERLIELEYSNSDLERIVEYVDANLTEKLSVTSLCREFNLSKNALYSLFNVHMGKPVKEYVNSRRMARAEELLKDTDIPTYEVCEKCGIDNYQYFCRVFRKEKGITPLQYRKRIKSGYLGGKNV
ncbi:MAG: helix-turn-helix transcriptional regulator, partial [Clostridia bacterium]|nr:helix-turn-helix transcriptional regulator [Clostridia bacterium]